MLRAKKLRAAFLFLPFVFCLYLSGVSVADDSCFQGLSTIPGNVQYDESWLLQWDPTNSDQMSREESEEIRVINGKAGFTWTISGDGFWFDADYTIKTIETKTRSVILYTDAKACSAKITVTDVSEDEVAGNMYYLTGVWVLKASGECVMSGPATLYATGDHKYYYEYKSSGKRQTEVTYSKGGGFSLACPQPCDEHCDWCGGICCHVYADPPDCLTNKKTNKEGQ